jgi:uncharacterized repeat protein (TIGR02543 family)
MCLKSYGKRRLVKSISGLFGTIFVVSLLLSVAAPAWAGINQWTSHGPAGGKVTSAAINPANPAIIYVGTNGGGIFRSTDAGLNWSTDNSGVTNYYIQALAVVPSDPDIVYAGTNAGLFQRIKGGTGWHLLPMKLLPTNFLSLAVDPTTPTIIYAGTAGGGIIKSTNGGGSWGTFNTGLGNLNITTLAIDPKTPATVYAGTAGGVFMSTNSGGTWSAVNTGLTTAYVKTLAIDPVTTPTVIYAGTSGGGVFKSTDGGGNWNAVNTGLSSTSVQTVAIDPVTPATIYAGTSDKGVFRSSNSGGNWSAVTSGLTNLSIQVLVINPTIPTTLYAGSGDGVFRSDTSGGAWSPANVGLNGITIRTLAAHPTNQSVIYAGSSSFGVFKSTDAGGTWSAINNGLTTTAVPHLAIDPATPTTIYAGTSGGGVFKSSNSGGTWGAINSGLGNLYITALAIDPTAPATLYAGTSGGGLFKSSDSGATWGAINTGLGNLFITALAINPTAPATLYLTNNNTGVVYKSSDSGANWTALAGTPLKDPLDGASVAIRSLAIDPASPATIYAITGGTLFKSSDAGGTWNAQTVVNVVNAVNALAFDPWTPTSMYALITQPTGAGVFKSIDSGSSWVNNTFIGGPIAPTLNALALSPTTPSLLFVGAGNGVYSYDQFAIFGTVRNVGTAPIAGATVTVEGTPGCTTQTLVDGRFTLSCIPYNTDFVLTITAPGYITTSSQVLRLISSTSGLDYLLHTKSQPPCGGSVAGKGTIIAQVRDASLALVADAVVTATGLTGTYSVQYFDGVSACSGSATGLSGLAVITNVDNADNVILGVTKTGWSFTSPSFPGRADAITEGAVIGTSNDITKNTVTYSGNGNTGGTAPVDASSPYASGNTVTLLTAGTLTRTGYTFSGWNTAANGSGTSYATGATFTITADTTFYAQWMADSLSVAVTINGTGRGTVTNVNTGASCNTTNTLPAVGGANLFKALAADYSLFTGWSGGFCTGTGDCLLTVTGPGAAVTATFDFNAASSVLLERTTPVGYYSTIQAAYDAAALSGDVIKTWSVMYPENLQLNGVKAVSIKGGYSQNYGTITGSTTIQGTVTLATGTTVFDGIVIR